MRYDLAVIGSEAAAFAAAITGVVTGAAVAGVRGDSRSRSVLLKTAAGGERELACEQVLVAAGRRPVTASLGLEVVGMRTGSRGEIVTDARQRTGNPRIWAAGDVTGGPPYVYTAAAQSSAAANALFGAEREVDYTALPRRSTCPRCPRGWSSPPGGWSPRSPRPSS